VECNVEPRTEKETRFAKSSIEVIGKHPDPLLPDMSEYQTQESLGILLGGRLGEEGLLGGPLEAGNEGTLLFDEIEKAHPRVLDILLQIVDAARVTMASGRSLDFSGFYIVLTSNLGSAEILTPQHSSFTTIERRVLARS
jgi:ATP-dependent Clp protease ATP-binding subunit ClpA